MQQEPVELPTEEDPLMAPASVTTSLNMPTIEQSNDPVVEQNEPPSRNSDTVELRPSTRAHQPGCDTGIVFTKGGRNCQVLVDVHVFMYVFECACVLCSVVSLIPYIYSVYTILRQISLSH